jgi:hypothetical protein
LVICLENATFRQRTYLYPRRRGRYRRKGSSKAIAKPLSMSPFIYNLNRCDCSFASRMIAWLSSC